jgi:hypothetical protein
MASIYSWRIGLVSASSAGHSIMGTCLSISQTFVSNRLSAVFDDRPVLHIERKFGAALANEYDILCAGQRKAYFKPDVWLGERDISHAYVRICEIGWHPELLASGT